eukprot:TRINITY_DN29642_c0_g1_i1.p1 TRINITY_DN29642_c0_g1~~TRINITY_DN29642_c0_g1_i1.p1  ORF type:complete len:182 (+),score=32.80 TRINITY_DN29642_c0_g1_i1:215-760(+)
MAINFTSSTFVTAEQSQILLKKVKGPCMKLSETEFRIRAMAPENENSPGRGNFGRQSSAGYHVGAMLSLASPSTTPWWSELFNVKENMWTDILQGVEPAPASLFPAPPCHQKLYDCIPAYVMVKTERTKGEKSRVSPIIKSASNSSPPKKRGPIRQEDWRAARFLAQQEERKRETERGDRA